MSSGRKLFTCKNMTVILISSLILGMMVSVIPWIQPNGGLWQDIHWANLPPYTREELPGLDSEVHIVRDYWGVPHIFASSTRDLYLACGYVHAQDRLFQLDLYRRIAQGKLSEIFGPEYLELDITYRTLGLNTSAAASMALLSPEVVELLESYADGINRYMETIGTKIPVEIRILGYFPAPWTLHDSLSIERFLAWVLSENNAFDDLQMASLIDTYGTNLVFTDLFPDTYYNELPVVPTPTIKSRNTLDTQTPELRNQATALASYINQLFELSPVPTLDFGASNVWVVNSALTDSSGPFLCSDPHLSLSYPPLWYEVHLIGPAENVAGITFPGIPFVYQGHNTDIAWGFTSMNSDVTDFYYYTWNPLNPNEYWWKDAWHTMTEQNTTLFPNVGGQFVPTTITLNATAHGPIFDDTGERFALKWTGYNGSTTTEALFQLTRASNHVTFVNAVQLVESPSLNFIYADTNDNIAYQATGLIPIRSPGDGPSVLNGSSSMHEWMGFIPFNELPNSLNPAQGFLIAANQRPVNSSYPYYLGYKFASAHRAQRITSFLNDSTDLSRSDMQQIQLDTLSLHATSIKDIIAGVILASVSASENPVMYDAATILQSWDGNMDVDSAGATIWASFSPNFMNATFYDEYAAAETPEGPYPSISVLENFTQINYGRWFDNILLPGTQTRDEIILSSFNQTVQLLALNLGSDPNLWWYGAIHGLWMQAALGDSLPFLNPPVVPIGGSEYTINYAPRFLVSEGASHRSILDLENFDNSVGVLAGGQRMNAYSNHYLDQLALWLTGEFHPLYFPSMLEEITVFESLFHLVPG